MGGDDNRRRAARLFWTILFLTATAGGWLWDQASGAPLAAGRSTPALNVVAGVVAAVGILLLTRMVWRLSGRGANGGSR